MAARRFSDLLRAWKDHLIALQSSYFLNKTLLKLASYLPITEVHGTVAILVSVDRLLE